MLSFILFSLWMSLSLAQKEPFRQDIVGQVEPLVVSVKSVFSNFEISDSSRKSFLSQQPRESYLLPLSTLTKAFPKVLYQHRISYPGATYLSVHFAYFNLPPTDFVVIQSRRNPAWSSTYHGTGRAQLGLEGGFFATHIPGDDISIEYYSTSLDESSNEHAQEYGYVIDQYARGTTPLVDDSVPNESIDTKSICDRDYSKEAKCYVENSQVYRNSQAVARLLVNGIASCTGWLIGCEGHLMTNHHCISSKKSALNTDVEFMAESKSCQKSCKTSFSCPGQLKTKGMTLLHADEKLDYALLKINFDPKQNQDPVYTRFSYLQLRKTSGQVDEPIYIPQHPRGFGKRVAMFVNAEANEVAKITRTNITNKCGEDQLGYFADTQSGSSGAPVLSLRDHSVIGLHHCGGCDNTAHRANNILKDLERLKLVPKCAIAGSNPPPPVQDDSDDDNDSEVRCVLKLSGCEPASKCRYDANQWKCVPRE